MTGHELIAAERQRQVAAEGFDAARDNAHGAGVLADAAYAYQGAQNETAQQPSFWPFEAQWWKPKGRHRNLVRAGALYAAAADVAERAQDFASRDRMRDHVNTCAVLLDSSLDAKAA